jgi:transaldolase / glucose-6-phosphate isomerase
LAGRRSRNDRHKLKFELAGPSGSDRYANGPRLSARRLRIGGGLRGYCVRRHGGLKPGGKGSFESFVEKRWKRIFVLDTIDPATVSAITKDLDLQRTIFAFASKFGKNIETQALLLYFLQRVKAQGISSPGRHFVAVTEQGLAEMAQTYQFRGLSLDPPGIKGRYSALIHFGLFLSAFYRVDPASVLSAAIAMRDLCWPLTSPEANPALHLAAFLAAAAVDGTDRFLLFNNPSLEGLPYRVGQVVSVSMCKAGRGLIPMRGRILGLLATCRQRCVAAIFSMQGDQVAELEEFKKQLEQYRTPTVLIGLNTPEELGAELFKWEVATALACVPLGVNPFSEPDFREGRERTAGLVEALATQHELPRRSVRVREAGIALYAEGKTRQEISTLSLTEALRTFFELKSPASYLAILAFVEQSSAVEAALEHMREQLISALGIPVLLGFGPRYLHYAGQVLKGGPARGMFLILTSEPAQDIEIPGAGYSFGKLQLAWALGDFESLESRRKLVVHLHLAEGVERGLEQLEQLVQHALRNARL